MKQTEIDFDRAAKLAIAENAIIPEPTPETPERMRASAAKCKAVLNVLNSFGAAIYPSIPTIQEQANVRCSRTVKRALARLEGLGLIIIEKRRTPGGHVGNIYKIVWSELALLDRRRKKNDGAKSVGGHKSAIVRRGERGERGDMVSERGDMVSERGDMMSRAWGHDVPLTPREPQENRHQPEPAAADFIFEAIGELLQSVGVRFWRPLASEFAALGLDVVSRAVRVYRANIRRLSGPGALVAFLRIGAWPVEGIVDPDAIAERTRAAARDRAIAEKRAAVEQIKIANAEAERLEVWNKASWAEQSRALELAREQSPLLRGRPDNSPLLLDFAAEILTGEGFRGRDFGG